MIPRLPNFGYFMKNSIDFNSPCHVLNLAMNKWLVKIEKNPANTPVNTHDPKRGDMEKILIVIGILLSPTDFLDFA